MKKEIIITGSGGQGIQLFGEILAETAIKEGKEVSLIASYGGEVTGGESKSEIIICDEKIDFPGVLEPDIVVILSAKALKDAKKLVTKKETMVFFDDALLTQNVPPDILQSASYFSCPASKMAAEIGNRKTLNIIMLGFFIKKTNLMKPETVLKIMEEKIQPKFMEINKQAFYQGLNG